MKPTRQPYLMFAVLLAFAPYLLATPSGNLISYQGRVVDANGNPLADGNYSASFRLYVDGAPTSFLETLTVAVRNGVFTAYLGGTSALPAFETSREYQLGVKVGAGTEVKQTIAAVPLARNAVAADTAATAVTVSDGAVSTAKVAEGAITSAKVADGAVTNTKIESVAATKVTGEIGTSQIADGAVTNAKIGSVAASKVTGQIASGQIANGAVTDAKIQSVSASKLSGLRIASGYVVIDNGGWKTVSYGTTFSATPSVAVTVVDGASHSGAFATLKPYPTTESFDVQLNGGWTLGAYWIAVGY